MDGILTIEGFDVSLAEGVYLLTPFAADAQDEMTVNFVEKYQAKTGILPNQFAADAYDGIYILWNAAKNAGITSETTPQEACDLITEQLLSMTYDGLTGTMTWGESGEVSKTPQAVIIKDGAYVSAQ